MSERCITCADEALPMRVLSVDHSEQLAACVPADGAGDQRVVEIALVDAVTADDVLLVHGGAAIARLRPSGAGGSGAGPA
jgi:hydrogenase maturation factor